MLACEFAKFEGAFEFRSSVDALDALKALNHRDVLGRVGVADIFRHLTASFLDVEVRSLEVQAEDSGVAAGNDAVAHFGGLVDHLLRRRT